MVDLELKLPEEFFQEENKDGYLVSRKMKEVWAVEMDLAVQLEKICKKHDIPYFADSGTLLGAARHKGFIPWDDDMDFVMMRPDYERFCRIAEKELSYPYFAQTERTDHGAIYGAMKIRNMQTLGKLRGEGLSLKNEGIFIDVFPLDIYPSKRETRKKYLEKAICVRQKMFLYPQVAGKLVDHLFKGRNPYFHIWQYNLRRYEDSGSNLIYCQQWELKSDKEYLYKKEWYSEIVYLPFEEMMLPAPRDYQESLKVMFGDWRKPARSPGGHGFSGNIFFDTG